MNVLVNTTFITTMPSIGLHLLSLRSTNLGLQLTLFVNESMAGIRLSMTFTKGRH
jgi:hypothetical protein